MFLPSSQIIKLMMIRHFLFDWFDFIRIFIVYPMNPQSDSMGGDGHGVGRCEIKTEFDSTLIASHWGSYFVPVHVQRINNREKDSYLMIFSHWNKKTTKFRPSLHMSNQLYFFLKRLFIYIFFFSSHSCFCFTCFLCGYLSSKSIEESVGWNLKRIGWSDIVKGSLYVVISSTDTAPLFVFFPIDFLSLYVVIK